MAVGGKVKGITIEFNGDTTKLGQAMKKINNDAKGVDKALKDVNRALKFNPGNTELLAQKQTLLKQKIEQTKEKLEALKKAQATMDAKGVDKNSQEYMELRREIIKTESQLKNFKKQADELSNVNLTALGNQFKDVGEKMQTVGTGMTKYVTAPIVAAGAGSVAAWKEVDNALDIVIAKTGATGQAAEDMGNIVKDIATTIPTDFETAGNAVGEVNTRFGVTGDELEDLSTKFIEFATLNETDVSTSIDLVQQAMSAFGMDASQAGEMLDILNKVGQNTGISVDQLAASMVTNSAALHEMGFDASQAAQFLGEMEMAGIDSSTMMSGLKKALANASAEGKPLNEALQDLQTSMEGASDDTEAMNLATELFGAKAGPAIAEACKNGVIDFNDLGGAVEDFGGSVETTFDETVDPIDTFQTTLNELKILGAEVGETLLTNLKPIIEKIADAIQRLAEWWGSLSPQMQNAILIIAGIAAVAGPLIAFLGSIISAIGTMMIMGPILFGMLGPFIPLILGIVAAVIAIIAIVTHWSEICEWFKGVWENFTAVIKAVWEQTSEYLKAAWEALKAVAQVVWEALKASIITPIKIIWSTIQTVWNAIKAFLTNAWDGIKNTAQTVWNTIKDNIITPIQNAWNHVKGIIDTMKSTISNIFNGIKNTAQRVWDGIKNAITQPIETAKSIVSGILDGIRNLFPLSIGNIFSNLKLPHFSWDWWNIGGLVKIPHITVDWYKKGGIFDSPTLAGIGEAGPEAVVPLSGSQMRPFAQAIASEMGGGASDAKLDQLIDLLQMYLPTLSNMKVVMDTGATVGALAPQMDRRLGTIEGNRSRMR